MRRTHPAQERMRGITSMLSAVFFFAIMDSLLKRVSSHYGPFQVASLRCGASMLFLLMPVAWRGAWSSLRLNAIHLHLLRAALGAGMLFTFIYAVRQLSMAQMYSIVLCAPLLMTALSVPLLREHVPARRWIAIGVGLCGVLVILQPGASGFGSRIAVLSAAASAVFYALCSLTVRPLSRANSNTSMVFSFLLFVGLISLALALPGWSAILAGDWPWIGAIGLSGALGQSLLTKAFSRAPPSVVGPFEYTSLLWGFAIDWIFWSAVPTHALLLGAAIVITSGIYIIWDERRLADLAYSSAASPP